MKTHVEKLVSLVMLIVFCLFCAMAVTLGPQARLMPLFVGVPGAALALFILVREFNLRSTGEPVTNTGAFVRRDIKLVAWIALCVLLVIAFGFTWGAPIAVAIYFLFVNREPVWIIITSTVFCFCMTELMLNRFLGAQLFDGLITTATLRTIFG